MIWEQNATNRSSAERAMQLGARFPDPRLFLMCDGNFQMGGFHPTV